MRPSANVVVTHCLGEDRVLHSLSGDAFALLVASGVTCTDDRMGLLLGSGVGVGIRDVAGVHAHLKTC